MPEQVRMDVLRQPLQPGPPGDPALHDPRPQPPAAYAHEHRQLADSRDCGALVQPARERFGRFPAHRDDPCLAALAEHAHGPVPQVEVLEVEPEQLREAQPGRIQEFHDGLVAHTEPVVAAERQQLRHGIGVESDRQALARLRRLHVGRGVVAHLAFADQVAEEAAHRGQPALHAARRQPAPMALRGEHAHVLRVDLRPGIEALRFAVRKQGVEVARVGACGVRRQPPFVAQALQEALDAA